MNPVHSTRFMFVNRKLCRTWLLRNLYKVTSSSVKYSSSNIIAPRCYIDIPNISLPKCLFDAYEKHAGDIYLINGEDGSNYTFAEVREKSLLLSSVLSRLGISKGDVVALISPNCPEYVIGAIGTIYLGAILTSVSPSFVADEIARQLNDSESSVVICHQDCFKETKEAVKNVKKFRHLIIIGDEQDGFLSFQKLMKNDDGKGIPSQIEIDPEEDLAILPYSSGTTGLPKGVMLTHSNLVSNMYQGMQEGVLPVSSAGKDTMVAVLPLYHIYGIYLTIINSPFRGYKNITMSKFSTANYVDIIEKFKATLLPTVPPIISALCNDNYATYEKLKSVENVIVAAAPVGQALHQMFKDKFGTSKTFLEGFGMTELSPASNFSSLEKFVPGSCGPPLPNTYEKIVDVTSGESLGPEQEGELCIKGPQVMKGYWKNPKATMETIKDGWLHTGDIAKVDSSGNIFIVDRLKELIKVKGYQVAPAELEDLLRTHPKVEDVAVVGIKDDKSGEIPRAFVVPSNDWSSPSQDELIQYVKDRMAHYKQLKGGVVFTESIPKAPSGKILRRLLKN